MTNAKKYVAILLSGFVLFELSLLFGITDYNIFLNISNQQSVFGNIMEILGELVAPYLFALSGIILALYYNSQPSDYEGKTYKAILGIVYMIAGIGYSIIVLNRFHNFWYSLIGIVITGVLFTITIYLFKKLSPQRLFQLYCIALTAIVYMISVLIIINIIKVFWGRVRPRDLETVADFTPWYKPNGITGNRSFPSGHTANAAILYIITMFAPLTKKKPVKVLLYTVSILWIVFMAFSRVYFGAHFASDVLYGATISIIIFYLSKYFTLRYIAKSLQ
ncbi:phosphatase PAP2 family protein [Paludicola sp. MB14-C6]|uniref:phosphatase PAP2 family protein n=1 Tax=Paludihabitans sp. MB14-C6 TaxID=3070656 RepID=UPI0027DE8F4A|nr:phosphatase PAP2 family protein [Paludicola sp. MB14-C6]WMJ23922.1 phosphatase PAP2 family protein [Paludicola sp. MB14-C6]